MPGAVVTSVTVAAAADWIETTVLTTPGAVVTTPSAVTVDGGSVTVDASAVMVDAGWIETTVLTTPGAVVTIVVTSVTVAAAAVSVA